MVWAFIYARRMGLIPFKWCWPIMILWPVEDIRRCIIIYLKQMVLHLVLGTAWDCVNGHG